MRIVDVWKGPSRHSGIWSVRVCSRWFLEEVKHGEAFGRDQAFESGNSMWHGMAVLFSVHRQHAWQR